MTKRIKRGASPYVMDGLAWPPVDPERIASCAADLLSDCRKIESARHGGSRGMRGKDGVSLSQEQIRIVSAIMLDTCRERGAVPPAELVDLIAHLLCGTPSSKLSHSLRISRGAGSILPEDPRFVEAVNFEWENPTSSARAVARAIGVAPGTVLEWRKHPAYARERRMIKIAQEEGFL